MLAVEGAVVGPSSTTTATFPTPSAATMTMATTASAPTVVAGAGVGLLPMVTVAAAAAAAAAGEPDPRSLLVPVTTLSGSNLATANNNNNSVGAGPTTTSTSTSNNNNAAAATNTIPNNANNPAPTTMEQAEEFVKPILKDGEILLEVECGQNKAAMYLSKLCQGSKGPCINFQGSWLTPNEFQFVSGRETAKDWKRSIRHHGKSLKLLLAKGILAVHPTMCDCEGCRIGAVLTRKGEKRRIPNGERKRKSTGNAPENSGTPGAFRAVTSMSAVKNQDGPSDPKRAALDKPVEGNQSPLKESSLLNLPPEAKEGSSVRQVTVDTHMPDTVSKLTGLVESRLTSSAPLMPSLASPERNTQNINRLPSALNVTPEPKESSGADILPRPPHTAISVSAPVSPSADVKVLSSSCGGAASISALDKSLSRLALYHAASASLKGSEPVGAKVPEPPRSMSAAPKCDNPIPVSNHDNDTNRVSVLFVKDNLGQSVADHQNCDARSPSPQLDVKESRMDDEATANNTDTAVCESDRAEAKDLRSEDNVQTVVSHSLVPHVKLCEPNNNSSSSIGISVSTPIALPASVAALTSPVIASAAPAASDTMPHMAESDPQNFNRESKPKHREPPSSTLPSSSLSSSSSTSLLSPHNKHSDKEGHITIRHPSPERQPQETDSPMKHHHHSQVKPAKEHFAEKHKDRKVDCSSSSSTSTSEHKDRHGSSSKDSKEMNSRHSHDRDSERRRLEERSDRDRKTGGSSSGTSGSSSKAEDGSSSSSSRVGPEPTVSSVGGGGRVEGIPTSAPVMPTAVPVPAPVADAAAFSEYMRLLAAGHNGFVPPSVGCIPGMFPIRPPTDASALGSAAMMHPMQAAVACGMFSSPTALLPKDMYPASAGTMPAVSYGYGAPGMTPLSLIPQQYSTAPSTSMLDYSRGPFPYLPWPNGLPLMMTPDAAMNAAAVAAAAAAGSSAKRSREEMESAAMDKRLQQLQIPPYAMGSITPMEYMAAYRGVPTPLSCGLESSMYEKNAELLRKRMYPDLSVSAVGGGGGGSGGSKGLVDSPYLASLPEYYRALYCCPCMENQPGDIRTWPVEEVVKLVSSLEGCSVYTEVFREQRVNGKILVLLTTEHLMKNLGMKLGPAVTLTTRVAKLLLDATRTSGCNMCQRLASFAPAVQSAVGYS